MALLLEGVGEGAAPEQVGLVGLDRLGHDAGPPGIGREVVVGVGLDLRRVVADERGVVPEPVAVLRPGVRRDEALHDGLQAGERRLLVGRREREAAVDQDHRPDQVGAPRGEDGGDEAAHRVADDDHRLVADGLDHGRTVLGMGDQAVRTGQGIRPPAAAQVGRDQGTVELGGQEGPGPRRRGDPVDREHRRAAARPGGDAERAAGDRDVEGVGHGSGVPPAGRPGGGAQAQWSFEYTSSARNAIASRQIRNAQR